MFVNKYNLFLTMLIYNCCVWGGGWGGSKADIDVDASSKTFQRVVIWSTAEPPTMRTVSLEC